MHEAVPKQPWLSKRATCSLEITARASKALAERPRTLPLVPPYWRWEAVVSPGGSAQREAQPS